MYEEVKWGTQGDVNYYAYSKIPLGVYTAA